MRTIESLEAELDALHMTSDRWSVTRQDEVGAIQAIIDLLCDLHRARQHDIIERIADLKREAGDE